MNERRTFCFECGGRMIVNDNGTTHHVNDDGEIDYDKDAAHVAYEDEKEGGKDEMA